jgi:acyl carrier protein
MSTLKCSSEHVISVRELIPSEPIQKTSDIHTHPKKILDNTRLFRLDSQMSKLLISRRQVIRINTVLQEIMGLDAVELVIAVEEIFDIAIPDGAAVEMITPAILISHVQEAVGSTGDRRACISLRAFHRVRASLMRSIGVSRSHVTLDTRISTLFPRARRPDLWDSFRRDSSLTALPDLRFGRGRFFSPTSVRDLVSIAVVQRADELGAARSWTNEEVRQVVRQIIREQLGIDKFRDSDEFVRDLGID